jgi:Cu-Zn family superoxide dismutase
MRWGSGRTGALALAIALAAGCGSGQQAGTGGSEAPATPAETGGMRAVAELSPTKDQTARGTVMFEEHADGLHVTARLSGLTPGEHGFHIHAVGDCSAPDASSAGPHFNPDSSVHGSPEAMPHHQGDLGNLTADANGEATYEKTLAGVRLATILGRAVVVHASPDDMTTQPAGNSGGRIGCGVIQAQ